jgi:methionyl-tRNA formyltransferase
MNIVILTSYTAANIYLVNYLTARHNVVAKVIEKKPPALTFKEKMKRRKNMLQKYGCYKTINKLLYNKYRAYVSKNRGDEIVRQALFAGRADADYERVVPSIEVNDINEPKSVEFVSAHKPDIIAVCGTTVLKPEVFELSKRGTINIHTGIIPEYRSADPIFWALYNNEPNNVGVTIHFVDRGIDTGPIIYQQAIEVTRSDDLVTLYCKCIKKGAELMSLAISDMETGAARTMRKEGVAGKAYYHMDLGMWQHLVFQRRFRKLKTTL